jgi:hypothetical protein
VILPPKGEYNMVYLINLYLNLSLLVFLEKSREVWREVNFLEFPGGRFLNAAKRINLSIFDFENYFWIELMESNKGVSIGSWRV